MKNQTLTLRATHTDPETGAVLVIEKTILCEDLEKSDDLQIRLYSEYRAIISDLRQTITRARLYKRPDVFKVCEDSHSR